MADGYLPNCVKYKVLHNFGIGAKIFSGFRNGGKTVKKHKFEIDMCHGSIMDKLISFSLAADALKHFTG